MIQHKIPNKNFIIFLKEEEWRGYMVDKNKEFKFKNLFLIFDYVSTTSNFLNELEELKKN